MAVLRVLPEQRHKAPSVPSIAYYGTTVCGEIMMAAAHAMVAARSRSRGDASRLKPKPYVRVHVPRLTVWLAP